MSKPDIKITQNVEKVEEGGTVVGMQVIHHGEPVLIPSEEEVLLHRAALRSKEKYHRWADEFYIHEESKVLPLFASPYEDDTERKREDLLKTIRENKRLLVLGEPGMGKTVAMERMMWETAHAEDLVVPILVQLLYFQEGDLIELIRVSLNETEYLAFDNTKSVRAFLRQTPCLILFDGLNEIPGRQREIATGAIANFMREFSEQRYVVTSRSQDELWRKLRSSDLIEKAVVIQRITEGQAQSYLEVHLGADSGQALYAQLDDSLRALARTPLLLWLIKEACQGSDQLLELPRNRGELFERFVMNKLLEREEKLELVLDAEVKRKALAELAFSLQLEHQLACDQKRVAIIFTDNGQEAQAASIMKESLLHGLLVQQKRPGKEQIRFMHQSVQEYFVALRLRDEVEIERVGSLFQKGARQLSGQNLSTWAKDNWWAESFVQLAGLVEESNWLAQKLLRVNPWLAWWCAEEGGHIQKNTRDLIEARSIRLLQSQQANERRRAVQTLAQMENKRVVEHLFFAAGDEDAEVAGLAMSALNQWSEVVSPLVSEVLGGESKRGWRAALRYLDAQPDNPLCQNIPWEEILDQPMAWVPPGEFLMGSDKNKDSKAQSDELPQHEVDLQGYWIGLYPVTVARWRAFVDESGHKMVLADSLKDPDDHPVRYVTWGEAMAYCNWWSEKTGAPVTLPSEAEWEKAARGTEGRIYPWGDVFDKSKDNTSETGAGKTTPVGSYSPASDSPYGCTDMAGNVWEWTRSKKESYPYKADDGRENLEGNTIRVVRGGSWGSNQVHARASYRHRLRPGDNLYYDRLGFRVVVRPPSL
jgi:formylglycine-generating enzyme required for sulfatase activity